MKRSLSLILLLVVTLLAPSCSTKFNVAAPYKSIAVVYGLLDMTDTAHYIRIEKAFLDNNKNVQQMAQTPDSLYFPVSQLSVVMEVVNANASDSPIVSSITLTRVDMAAEGYPKQSGIFSTTSYAYKFKAALNPNYLYRLVIKNSATGETDSAQTPIVDDQNHNVFNLPLFDIPSNVQAGMNFYSTASFANFSQLYGTYTPSSSEAKNAVSLFQGVLRFRWVDSSNSTGRVEDSADYDLSSQPVTLTSVSSVSFSYQVADLSLYQFLASNMGTAAAGHVRLMDSCDIYMYAATPDFYTYQQQSALLGTGLTAGTIEPIYTNIQGKNVLGLFTSRGFRYARIPVNGKTVDSLRYNPIFSNVNLAGTAY